MDTLRCLLGVDIGGSGAKAGLFAVGSGERLGRGTVEYAMHSDVPGQAEHDAGTWWDAAAEAIRQALSGVDPAAVCGVGVSCTNGLVAVDAAARPLRRAIMLWDQRALPEVARIADVLGAARVFEITGNPLAPGAYSLPTILWLARHEPRIFEAADRLLVPGGYLVARLTGEFTIDHSRACTTLLFDIRRRTWHHPFLEALAIPAGKLPRPLPSLAVAGRVTREAGAVTGLASGTPVVAGCMDTVAAALGSGVMEPGRCFVIMGTAARVCAMLDEPRFDARVMNCAHLVPDRWLAIGALNGVGSSWRWVRDTFGQCEQAVGALTGCSPYDLLTAEAAQAPPGSKGLIFLPYVSGERTPIWNPLARGVLLGLTLGHTRNDVLRSVLEGAAFAIRQAVGLIARDGTGEVSDLRLGGAAARSEVWSQIIADVLGLRVVGLCDADTEVVGAALLAGVGLGVYETFGAAIENHVRTGRVFEPNAHARTAYDQLYPLYRDLYRDVEPYFTRLAGIDLPKVWVGDGGPHARVGHSSSADDLRTSGLSPEAGSGPGRELQRPDRPRSHADHGHRRLAR